MAKTKDSPAKTPVNSQKKKSVESSHDISCNINCSCNCEDNLKEIKAEFENTVNELKREFNGKIDLLKDLLSSKDKVIAELGIKIGTLTKASDEVIQGLNFVTKETTDLKDNIDQTVSKINTQANEIAEVKDKARDLEDRSRRGNIVMFGVPEAEGDKNVTEKTEELLIDVLEKHSLLNKTDLENTYSLFERVHRLGPRKEGKTRPIIAKCSFYKDKERWLKSSSNLKGTPYSLAEDYCKTTLDIRRQLVARGKEAKDSNDAVLSFRVNYKRLVLRCLNKSTNMTFFRGFNLSETNHPGWHKLTFNNPSNPRPRGDGFQG